MRPEPRVQIRFGAAAAVLILTLTSVAAFVPDPFLTQKVYATSVDNVDSVAPGLPVYFAGGQVGQVRWVRLDPARNLYAVGVGLRRDWRPPPCAVVRIAAVNPLAAAKIEVLGRTLGAVGPPQSCQAFRLSTGCARLAPPAAAAEPLDGCLRQGDLTQLAAAALAQASQTLVQGQALLARFDGMAAGAAGKGAGGFDLAAVGRNVTSTSASLDAISAKLNATLSPQRQADLSAAIGDLRTVSGKAAAFDMASVQTTVARTNALLEQMNGLLQDNRRSIQAMASQGAGLTSDSRSLLSAMQADMVAASANLERSTSNLDALSERLNGDPGFLVKGARYADPPQPDAPR